jgi:hypothetical protein
MRSPVTGKYREGIEGKTRFTRFEIKAWSANTIRVRITKEKTFNPVQYALAADTGAFFRL